MRYLFISFFRLWVLLNIPQDTATPPGTNHILSQNWKIQSSEKAHSADSVISTSAYKPSGWYPAVVPGTVLGSLVADSVFKDVFFNKNLKKIPDSLFNAPWWYRTTFAISRPDSSYLSSST